MLMSYRTRLRQWLRDATGGGAGAEATRLLGKWVFLGLLIGVVAGAGAVLFKAAIDGVTAVALGRLVAYQPPTPLGEGDHPMITPIGRPWVLPLVVTGGAFLSGIVVRWLAPEAEGHGTDAAIEAYHFKGGRVRRRVPPVKLIASALTIGSGGSGGREGPTAQMSAGFGSALADWLGLSAHDRRIALATGMGAGIGAIFRAPLGGAMMAAEILYTHDLEAEAIIPALIAAIIGYSLYGAVTGWTPIFGEQARYGFHNPFHLIAFAALGVLCGLVGILYARTFYAVTRLFHRLPGPWVLRPALGGLLVGLLGLALPGVLHTGYGWVQIGMGSDLDRLALWVVLLLPFAKILATSLSIGSGGSGGIFGPGMVIGGMLGAACWRVGHDVGLPWLPDSPAPFVIVGMMALFGSVAHAPLAVMLMVAEMTGNLALLAPAMVAVGLATLVVGDETIYRAQLPSRADSPAHRFRYSFPLLASLPVRDAMLPLPALPTPSTTVQEALAMLADLAVPGLPVAEQGRLVGTVSRNHLLAVPEARRAETSLAQVMAPPPHPLWPDLPLDAALDVFAERGLSWLPVVDEQGRVAGVLSALSLARTYRRAAARRLRPGGPAVVGATVFEIVVTARSPLTAAPLHAVPLPRETLIVSVRRQGEVFVPRGDTHIRPGDAITVVTTVDDARGLQDWLAGTMAAGTPLS
jgi:CIC family chloride channel protein